MRLVHALALVAALFAVACDEGAPQDPNRPGAGAGTRTDEEAEDPSRAAPAPATPARSAAPSTSAPASAAPNITFAEQAAAGEKLYRASCARCHSDSGFDAAELRSFATAADFASYIIANMPPGGAGRLTNEEYYSIVAFDLKANGLAQEHALDAQAAAKITLR